MPNGNRNGFSALENYFDMVLNVVSIYIAYFFACLILAETPLYPNEPVTVVSILVVVISGAFAYQALNMYKIPTHSMAGHGTLKIIRINLIFYGVLAVIAALFAKEDTKTFMVVWVAITDILSTLFLTFKRRFLIRFMRLFNVRKFNLRKIIIVGDNVSSIEAYISEIAKNPQSESMVIGYVGNKDGADIGCEKLGGFPELEKVLEQHKPTDVVFAIDSYDKRHLIRLVNICDDRCVKVYFLPVIYGFFKSSKQIEQIGDLPVINIHNTPLDNRLNAAVKRIIDVIGSFLLIVITSPVMLVAAIGTKLSSPGPILFRQKRVGTMGKPFTMLKFRSMWVNTESDSAWSSGTDARKTKFGTFIRRTAIDELPQLFNVLKGDMSLVGPRPEIPKFVNDFKKTIPLYMIKHYVKPGMTGLAQIKGLRGDTSVEDRIHEDIAYIEKWTLLLDLYILMMTPLKAFNKNEKYVEIEIADNPDLYGLTEKSPELFEIETAISEQPAEESAAAEGEGSEKKAEEKNEQTVLPQLQSENLPKTEIAEDKAEESSQSEGGNG